MARQSRTVIRSTATDDVDKHCSRVPITETRTSLNFSPVYSYLKYNFLYFIHPLALRICQNKAYKHCPKLSKAVFPHIYQLIIKLDTSGKKVRKGLNGVVPLPYPEESYFGIWHNKPENLR